MQALPKLRCVVGIVAALSLVATARASSYSTAVQALNPIDYWQFGGPTTSGSTSLNQGSNGLTENGTYQSGVSAGAGIPVALFPGFTGGSQSLSFAGAGSIKGSDTLEVSGNGARTITAWINTTTDDAQYHEVFSYGTLGTGNQISTLAPPGNLDTNFGQVGGNFGPSQYGDGVGTPNKINDGTWHFIAFTVTPESGGQALYQLYVDGIFEAQKSMQTNTTLGGGTFIGNDISGNSYDGQIAQVAVFNTALSSPQIAELYAAAFTAPVPEPSSIAALVGMGSIGLVWFAKRRRQSRRLAA